jgi:hypothetical protein
LRCEALVPPLGPVKTSYRMPAAAILERLVAMKRDPAKGWTLDDVAWLCRALGIRFSAPGPTAGYAVVSHPKIPGLLTLPSQKKLKPYAVMLVVGLVEGMLAA